MHKGSAFDAPGSDKGRSDDHRFDVRPCERFGVPAGAPFFDLARRNLLQDQLGAAVLDELDQVYWDGAPRLLQRLQDAVASGDRWACEGLLHTIAGSSLNLGLAAVAKAAREERRHHAAGLAIDVAAIEAALLGTLSARLGVGNSASDGAASTAAGAPAQ